MNPKISVIIPVYNVEKYLDCCIQSVINQTLQNIEIILVDDESPDNCPQLCDEYAKQDKRIKVVHKKNGGLGFARNSGLEVATGEYVVFLDSDDFVDRNTYELAYNYLIQTGHDSIYFRCDRFCDESEISGTQRYNLIINPQIVEVDNIREFMLNLIANKPHCKKDRNVDVSSCFVLYKLAIIQKYNLRFHSERELVSEDLVFNLDYLEKVRSIVLCDNQFYHYRINLASLTRTHKNDYIDRFYIFYEYMMSRYASDCEAQLRAKRSFIGYSRNRINLIAKSKTPLKQRLEQISYFLNKPYWPQIYATYPVSEMPFSHYAPLFMIRYKLKIPLFLICRFLG